VGGAILDVTGMDYGLDIMDMLRRGGRVKDRRRIIYMHAHGGRTSIGIFWDMLLPLTALNW
jgi:hypothetical protein